MKDIIFSKHSIEQLNSRGASVNEVKATVFSGEQLPAKKGRIAFRKNFAFNKMWKGSFYENKQVMPILKEENNKLIVITVYVFYFGGKKQ